MNNLNLTVQKLHGFLIAAIPPEPDDEEIGQIQAELLSRISAGNLKGVVIDLSRVEMLDTFHAGKFADISRMAALLGAVTIFTGFRPQVVPVLVELNFNQKNILTAVTLEGALALLNTLLSSPQEAEDEEWDDGETEGEDDEDDDEEEAGEEDSGGDEEDSAEEN